MFLSYESFDRIRNGEQRCIEVDSSWYWRSRIFTSQYRSTCHKKYVILHRGITKVTLMFEVEDANWLWETIYIRLGWRMGDVQKDGIVSRDGLSFLHSGEPIVPLKNLKNRKITTTTITVNFKSDMTDEEIGEIIKKTIKEVVDKL